MLRRRTITQSPTRRTLLRNHSLALRACIDTTRLRVVLVLCADSFPAHASSNLLFAIPQYSFEQSTARNFLPNCFATSAVVPAPENGSITSPFSGQLALIQVSTSVGGNTAKWASRNFDNEIDQTVRLFRPLG